MQDMFTPTLQSDLNSEGNKNTKLLIANKDSFTRQDNTRRLISPGVGLAQFMGIQLNSYHLW